MKDKEMFASDRYVTSGVQEAVPFELQLMLWRIIEARKERGDKLDYLQVFELAIEMVDDEPLQKVLTRQEHPFHEEVFYVNIIGQPVHGVTVWIMDSGDYCTSLLPMEY